MAETRPSELTEPACCAAGESLIYERTAPSGQKILLLLTTDSLGRGNEELGRKIVINFIRNLKEMGGELWRLVLLNGGVKLAVEGSEALPQLQDLARRGLDILVCGPCLKTFDLFEKKQVGELLSMTDLISSMQVADKVITF